MCLFVNTFITLRYVRQAKNASAGVSNTYVALKTILSPSGETDDGHSAKKEGKWREMKRNKESGCFSLNFIFGWDRSFHE